MALTLVERTEQQIEEMILNKEFDENFYLPSEGELCKKFSVSRVTVRDAVKSLETRGFLKRIHGKGLLVIDNSSEALTKSITDMFNRGDCNHENLKELRFILECACAEKAASIASDRELQILRRSCEAMENSETMDDTYFENDLLFHIQLIKSSGNPILSAIVDAYTPVLKEDIISSSHRPYVIEKKHHFHRNIYNAIAAHDSAGAAAAVKNHLIVATDFQRPAYKEEE